MATNLLKVKYADSKQDQVYKNAEVVRGFGAPYLVPAGAGEAPYDIWANIECPWSISPKSVTQYVPNIELKEFRLKYSSELLSLINSARGRDEALDRLGVLTESDNKVFTLIRDISFAAAGNLTLGAATQAANGAGGRNNRRSRQAQELVKIGAGIAGFGQGYLTGKNIQDTFSDPDSLLMGFSENRKDEKSLKDPYSGLYYATPTNLRYNLPYVNIENMVSIDSSWKEPAEDGIISKTLSNAKDFLSKSSTGAAAGLTAFDLYLGYNEASMAAAEPGYAREKIKGFAPSENGDSVAITFYLYNTLGVKQIRNNWEFLYVLTYQNLPNRRSINLLDPPCVYEVTIPGHKHYPVAVIEKLSVQNIGTTKCINIETGELSTPSNNYNVKIIPEAYQVKLTIRNLLTTTQNLFKWSDTSDQAVNVFKKELSPQEKQQKEEKAQNTAKQFERAASPIAGGGSVGVFIPPGGFNAQNSSSVRFTDSPKP